MRSHEPASADAIARHQDALAESDRQVLERRFEAHYATRSRHGHAA
jgi:hypothetical protein